MPRRNARSVLLAVLLGAVAIAGPVAATTASPPATFNAVQEAQNYSKVLERQAVYLTPEYQLLLRTENLKNGTAGLAAAAADPQREFVSDLCWNLNDGCAGDVRLDAWQSGGFGHVAPVLFTARNGATLSGHIWWTQAGPARRPGAVITVGSVQAVENLYWYAAQTLAKAGYVVMTWDAQGQGQSDTSGEAPDAREGVPAQTDGRPFFDGTEDALNFFFSTAAKPYVPVPSCNSGTSHAAKQAARVASGKDAGFNPAWQLLDPSRVGIAGHSYGASGVSYIGQQDPRVKAIVAWDNLATPSPAGNGRSSEQKCVDANARKPAAITKPALGMSADYFLPPTPNTSLPNPRAKSTESLAYTKAGVDAGEIIIRGGSHFDFSYIPNPAFGASLRGADEVAWYTTAWFDRYVKGDPSADARILTGRWRHDGSEGSVDPNKDANDFSFYYLSRLAIHTAAGVAVDCEDLRDGCTALSDDDGWKGDFSYLGIDTLPDSPSPTPAFTPTAGHVVTAPVREPAKDTRKPQVKPATAGKPAVSAPAGGLAATGLPGRLAVVALALVLAGASALRRRRP